MLANKGQIFTGFRAYDSRVARCIGGKFAQDVSLPGANPTTLSNNASVVKIYSATNSLARF
jgi:hypothetical protein